MTLKAHATILARVAAMNAHIAQMQTANQHSLEQSCSLAYTEDHFANLPHDFEVTEAHIDALFELDAADAPDEPPEEPKREGIRCETAWAIAANFNKDGSGGHVWADSHALRSTAIDSYNALWGDPKAYARERRKGSVRVVKVRLEVIE